MSQSGTTGGSSAQRELQALRAWRDEAVRARRLLEGALKDSDLVGIVTFGRKDRREVSRRLTHATKGLADEIVEVLVEATGRGAPAAPATAPVAPVAAATAPAAPAVRADEPRADPAPAAEAAGGRAAGTDAGTDGAPGAPGAAAEEARRQALAEQVARFVPTRSITPAPTPGTLRLVELADGLRLRWSADPAAAGVTRYRVLSTEDTPPYSPDKGHLVDLTGELTTVDRRPPTSARRFYRVYSYSGPDEEQMFESQPTLLAGADYVPGVQDLAVEEDEGRIIGRWRRLPGADRVHVFRIPVEELHLAGPAEERYRLNEEDNLAGFVDKAAVRGRRYRYDCYVQATIDGQPRWSEVRSIEHAVSASLTRVTDLQVVSRFDHARSVSFDLSWTTPEAGDVLVFRTEKPPLPGATHEVHAVEALPQVGLEDSQRLKPWPAPLGEGREGIADVPGREDWSRIHFTPVTVLDGRARVGDTVTQLVVGEPVQAELVERCDHQVLKFGWPRGAAKVVAVVRGADDPLAVPAPGEPQQEMDEDTYLRLGGMQLRGGLPGTGCAVHLVGQAFEAGVGSYGPPVAVPYPGLLRLAYVLETRQRRFRLDRVVVRLRAEREVAPGPAFVLVHHRDRLPLHSFDGDPLEVTLDIDTATAPTRVLQPERLGPALTPVGWSAQVRGLSGYLRLFVDQGQGRFALLDPPPAALVLRP
jgi:hypothetical protein